MKLLLALDLDHTLIYPADGRPWSQVVAEEMFLPQGVPVDVAVSAYKKASALGTHLTEDIAALIQEDGYPIDVKKSFDLLHAWYPKGLASFADTKPLYSFAKEKVIPIAIVTAGHEINQKLKVEATKTPYDLFYAVDTPAEKATAIKKLLTKGAHHVVFVDDHPEALDSVVDSKLDDQVTPVRILRGPHLGLSSRFPHREVSSLEEIIEILKEKGIE